MQKSGERRINSADAPQVMGIAEPRDTVSIPEVPKVYGFLKNIAILTELRTRVAPRPWCWGISVCQSSRVAIAILNKNGTGVAGAPPP